jgi:uncharacterized DUF497 family protein
MWLVFEWDPRKARSNLRKHGMSFAEAISVFGNSLAWIFPDDEHSPEESREIIVGHSAAPVAGLLYGAENWAHSHRQCRPRHEGRAARL